MDQNLTYEELVQLQQEGKITLVQFIEAQEDLADAWAKWKAEKGTSEESADAFLTWYEDEVVMKEQEL